MPRVLVTGAAGMIGAAALRRFREEGRAVTAVDVTDHGNEDPELKRAPLEDFEALQEAVSGPEPIQAIIHCGAISGPMLAQGDPGAIVRANVVGVANILELARIDKVERLIFCSSIGVYGDAPGGPGPEDRALKPTSVYGGSKVAGEGLITGYAAEYDVDTISLRIARVYGPGRRGNCHIKTMIERTLRREPAEIPCDAAFVYHYVYIDDVVDAIMAALQVPRSGHQAFNISGQRPQTMSEIVEDVHAALPGADIRLVPGVDDVPDVHHWFDLSAAQEALGWTPKRGIRDGVRDYAEHLRKGLT